MQLILVRHARPVRMEGAEGQPDPPLGDVGSTQVKALGAHLSREMVSSVYTSPLLRARETAEILARPFNLDPVVDANLSELHLGEDHYIPPDELNPKEQERLQAQTRAVIAGGSANPIVTDFRHRSLAAIDRIGRRQNQEGKAIVVCHLGVINAVITAILGISELVAFELEYTSVSRVFIFPDGMRAVYSVNETCHLQA